MEQGWDPDVKDYFVRILNTIAAGLIWMIAGVTAGIYYGLAIPSARPIIYNIIFYIALVGSLGFLIRYYLKLWRK